MIYSLEGKNLEKNPYFRKSLKECIFFLGNKVEFVSPDHMRLWASSLSFWHVDKTEADPGEGSLESMAGSTRSVCQCVWCHVQIKTIPSEVQPPDWTSLCPCF